MADEHESVIPIESDADVVTARQQERAMASGLDLTSTDQTLLATAISEVARNITAYAQRGEVLLKIVRDDNGRQGIQVVARDDGPGIENVEQALQDGYTSGSGLGLGLPGARRLVHEFHIDTAPGRVVKAGSSVLCERAHARYHRIFVKFLKRCPRGQGGFMHGWLGWRRLRERQPPPRRHQ